MNRRNGLVLGVVMVAVALLGVVLSGQTAGDRPTIRSAQPGGYRAAYAYLEAQGAPVLSWEWNFGELASGDETPSPQVLLLAAPFQLIPTTEEVSALERWVSRGGRLVLLTSGRRQGFGEMILLPRFALTTQSLGQAMPVEYGAWRRFVVEPEVLEFVGDDASPLAGLRVACSQLTHAVVPSETVSVLFADADGTRRVYEFGHGSGKVIVVNDASIFSNDRLGEAQNLAFLETLLLDHALDGAPAGDGVAFCEWIHGFVHVGEDDAGGSGAIWWLLVHGALVYLGVVWLLRRRFGPEPRSVSVPASSVRRDLDALAVLHHQGRHARDAGARMVEAERELEGFDGTERGLLALARRIGERQREGR